MTDDHSAVRTGPPQNRVRAALAVAATVILAAATAFALAYEPPPPPLPPLEVTCRPAEPTQGHLFMMRVAAPPDSGAVSATGEAGGESLHFHATESALESLAPVRINATDSIDAWVQATYPDGRTQTDTLRIPVVAGTYEHERLTVAPRFGSPPDEEDQAGRARDWPAPPLGRPLWKHQRRPPQPPRTRALT